MKAEAVGPTRIVRTALATDDRSVEGVLLEGPGGVSHPDPQRKRKPLDGDQRCLFPPPASIATGVRIAYRV